MGVFFPSMWFWLLVMFGVSRLTDGFFAGGGHHQGCAWRFASERRGLGLEQHCVAVTAWTEAESDYDATAHADQRCCCDGDHSYNSLRVVCP